MSYLFLSLVSLLLFTGCSTKATVYALKPALVDSLSRHKNVTVDTFIGDRINFSNSLKSELLAVSFHGEPYFNLSHNAQTHLRGKATVHSDTQEYYNEYVRHYNKEGKLLNTDRRMGLRPMYSFRGLPMIVNNYNNYYTSYGSINNYNNDNDNRPVDAKEGYTNVEHEYCTKRIVRLEGYIDVSHGSEILHHKSFNEESDDDECHNDNYYNSSSSTLAYRLRDRVIRSFIKEIAPRMTHYRITLLDKADIPYSKAQKILLKQGLKSVKDKNYAQAKHFFTTLNEQTAEKSYVALYNLGVVNESLHAFIDAKQLYEKAQKISAYTVEEINDALLRVDNVKQMENKAKLQINR